jgi:adenosine deaminase
MEPSLRQGVQLGSYTRYYRGDMSLPSVLLHDRLDGGLCPATVLELAETDGYTGLHPFGLLYRAGINVTLSTDNRL